MLQTVSHLRLELDLDRLERIWHRTYYNELRVSPEEHPVLLTEAPVPPRRAREWLLQVLFETFGVPAVHLAAAAVLALYASNCVTGVVLDAGHATCHAVPVHEGNVIPHAVVRLDLGGRHLTQHLASHLEAHASPSRAGDHGEAARFAKEQLCYVAPGAAAGSGATAAGKVGAAGGAFELPDGSVVELGQERFLCPEALFRPCLLGKSAAGIHQAIFDAVAQCDEGCHEALWAAVVLAGGSTMFRGIRERLQKELLVLLAPQVGLRVLAPPDRKYSAWLGGSIVASLGAFQARWVTKADYDERGLAGALEGL